MGNRVLIEHSYIHTFSYIPHRLDRVWTEIVLVQWRNDQSALVNLQTTYIYNYIYMCIYIYPFAGAALFADLPAGCQPSGDQFTMPFGLAVAINGHDLVKKANS